MSWRGFVVAAVVAFAVAAAAVAVMASAETRRCAKWGERTALTPFFVGKVMLMRPGKQAVCVEYR